MSRKRRRTSQTDRARVFLRSDGRCVVCAAPAAELHNVLDVERFPNYETRFENLVGVCSHCQHVHETGEQLVPIAALPRDVLRFVYGLRQRSYLEATHAVRDWRRGEAA